MIDEEELIAMLRLGFAEEAAEGLVVLNQLLCQAEQAGLSQEDLDRLYRTAHNLKGAAGAADLGAIVAALHELETRFAAWREAAQVPTAEAFDEVYAGVDRVAALLKESPSPATTAAMGPDPGLTSDRVFFPDELPPPLPEVPAERPEGLRTAGEPESRRRAEADQDGSIRIALDKLNDLMAKIGEILFVRIKSEQRLGQTKAMRERVVLFQRRARQAVEESRRVKAGDTARVTRLIDFVQETARWLRETETALVQLEQTSSRDHTALSILSANLQDDIKQLRLQPLATIFDQLPRVARDTARAVGKQVTLTISGGEAELDKKVVETLKDPLVHLIRNAIDHGLEFASDRQAVGKPAGGTVAIRAEQVGTSVRIQVRDDGRGIDTERVVAKMVGLGRWTPAQAATFSPDEIHQAILQPGFSTASAVTEISGRGVGMDVVASQVRELKGQLTIRSTPGEGTTMVITLPISMVTGQGLFVAVNGQTYVMPIDAVERLMRIRRDQVQDVQGRAVFTLDGVPLSLVSLRDVLTLPAWVPSVPPEEDGWLRLMILRVEDRCLALLVDEFAGEQEMVIKPLGYPLSLVPYLSGATLDGAGRVVPILNPLALMDAQTVVTATPAAAPPVGTVHQTILVVDDSPTIQRLHRGILEGAGFEVALAADGQAAWDLLQRQTPTMAFIDLDMPRMDGFELLSRIRRQPATAAMPVIVVSSRDDDATRQRLQQLGATDFVTKAQMEPGRFLRLVAAHI